MPSLQINVNILENVSKAKQIVLAETGLTIEEAVSNYINTVVRTSLIRKREEAALSAANAAAEKVRNEFPPILQDPVPPLPPRPTSISTIKKKSRKRVSRKK